MTGFRKGPPRYVLGGIFIVAGVLFLLIRGKSIPRSSASPPGIVVLYARVTGVKTSPVIAWCSSSGRVRKLERLPGRLGLTGQWQAITTATHQLFVATGGGLWVLTGPNAPPQFYASPEGSTLEVYAYKGQVFVVTDTAAGPSRLWTWTQSFRRMSVIPRGLIRFIPGRHHPWLLLMRPHSAEIWWPTASVEKFSVVPAASAAAVGRIWLPFVQRDQAGLVETSFQGGRPRYWVSSMARGILAVTPTAPVWGISARGMVPLSSSEGPDYANTRAFPRRMQTSVTVKTGDGWDMVLDGPAQGLWFNPRQGRFAANFKVRGPTGAIPMAVAVWVW